MEPTVSKKGKRATDMSRQAVAPAPSAEVAPVRRRGGLGVGRKLVARLWRLAHIHSSG
jgi:hypothetical protein